MSLVQYVSAELADRLAIRTLVDAYAHGADRRDAKGQQELFTEDTHFVVYMDGEGTDPSQELNGREALTPVFADLNSYEATTHFNGQSTVTIDGTARRGGGTQHESEALAAARAALDAD